MSYDVRIIYKDPQTVPTDHQFGTEQERTDFVDAQKAEQQALPLDQRTKTCYINFETP